MGRTSGGSGGGGGFANPMTTAGDLILGGTAGAAGRLATGSGGNVFTVSSSTGLPQWDMGLNTVSNQASGNVSVNATTSTDLCTVSLGAGLWQVLAAAMFHYYAATANVDVWLGTSSASPGSYITSSVVNVNATGVYETVFLTALAGNTNPFTIYLSCYASAAVTCILNSPEQSLVGTYMNAFQIG